MLLDFEKITKLVMVILSTDRPALFVTVTRYPLSIMLHRWIRNFFGFSRSQTNAFIILLPLLTIVIFSAPAYRWWVSNRTEDFSSDQVKLDSLIALWDSHEKDSLQGLPDAPAIRLFAFDPNIISESELQVLGFPEKLAIRITHYRQKGGRFKVKADLLKIYGVDSAFYRQLFPFIQLPEKPVHENEYAKAEIKPNKKAPERFNLNEADTAQLKKVYGIGEKLSLRITKYRDLLGGFVTMKQVSEIYGLDTAVVNRLIRTSFIADDFQPKRINPNTATEKELSNHPYLKGHAAKAIVAYRFQHGEIRAVGDLQNIQSIDPLTIQKIEPYLEFRN